eukprot:142893_1
MSEDLERILAQFLKVNRHECCYELYDKEEKQDRKEKYLKQHATHVDWNLPCMVYYICNRFHQVLSDEQIKQMNLKKNVVEDNKEDECLCRKQKIFPVTWNKFEKFRKQPNIRQRVKFDKISNYLKRFFMEESKDEKDVKSGDAKW